jgi:hypothetical protein
MADKASQPFGALMWPKTGGTELGESFDTGGGDVGLGGAETRMAAVGRKLSRGEASANCNFRAFNRLGLPNGRMAN